MVLMKMLDDGRRLHLTFGGVLWGEYVNRDGVYGYPGYSEQVYNGEPNDLCPLCKTLLPHTAPSHKNLVATKGTFAFTAYKKLYVIKDWETVGVFDWVPKAREITMEFRHVVQHAYGMAPNDYTSTQQSFGGTLCQACVIRAQHSIWLHETLLNGGLQRESPESLIV